MAKVAVFHVSDEFLIGLTKGVTGGFAGRFKVTNGLPSDAEVMGVKLIDKGKTIAVTVSSSEFRNVQKGQKPPVLPDPLLEALRG